MAVSRSSTRFSTNYTETETLMIESGLLNPQILSLLARVRHTNTLVIADRGFPSWPRLEIIDLSLIDDIPTVLQVVNALRGNFRVGAAWMASEFAGANLPQTRARYEQALEGVALTRLPHNEFKKRVESATGLIRTGDTTQYGNLILESA